MHNPSAVGVGIVVLLLAFLIYFESPVQNVVSGLASGFPNVTFPEITLSVEQVTDGRIFLFFEPILNLGDTQNVTIEFYNTGSVSSTTRIQSNITYFNGTELLHRAFYFDSQEFFYPGKRDTFTYLYTPNASGIYVIRVDVPFEEKTISQLGAFVVLEEANETEPPPSGESGGSEGGGGGGGGGGQTNLIPGEDLFALMNLTFPEKVFVEQGGLEVVGVKARNVGDVRLSNLVMFFATDSRFTIDVNPQQIARLGPPHDYLSLREATFLVSIDAPIDMPLGEYSFDFEVLSDQRDEGGVFIIEVVPAGIDPTLLQQRLISYRFLIADLDQQIKDSHADGFDVTTANESLTRAKISWERANIFLENREYENARNELQETKSHLERTALILANISLFSLEPPDLRTTIVFIIAVVSSFGMMVFLVMRRAKKKKRPKLLRKANPEGGKK